MSLKRPLSADGADSSDDAFTYEEVTGSETLRTSEEREEEDEDDSAWSDGGPAPPPADPRPQRAAAQEAPSEDLQLEVRHSEDSAFERPACDPRERNAVDREREELRKCPLCWDEQPYLAAERRNGSAKTAMLQKIQDFRQVIFKFENLLVGRQNDEIIYWGMLQLRKLFIEQFLSDNGYRFVPWTIEMVRTHYDPAKRHKFDLVRELDDELQELKKVRKWMMQHAMFVPNPDTGDPMFNVKAVDVRLRLSKQYETILTKLHGEIRRRDGEGGADTRLVTETVNGAVNRLAGIPAVLAADPLVSMYDVGGA